MAIEKEKAAEKPVVQKPVVQKSTDTFKVENVSTNAINLAKGRIEPGAIGIATRAELQNHSDKLSRV